MFRNSSFNFGLPNIKVNPTVRAYIISESFLWSAWNFVLPIIAVFASNELPGGNVKVAAMLLSISFWERTVCELFVGKYFSKSNKIHKVFLTIIGLVCISVAYLGFSVTQSLPMLTFFFTFLGIGWGIASPIKNSIFAMNLDKNRESYEIGLYDAVTLVGMSLAIAIGGIVAYSFGFRLLFLMAAV